MIEPRYGVLQNLFADRVFRIPHYQRFYSWKSRQRQDLFADLRNLATRGEDQHHFMATIVCHRTAETKSVGTNQYRVYDVVDGQQRLTTLILLLKCIELAMSDSEDRKELANILVKKDGHLILLQTNNANEHIFNKFLKQGVLPTPDELQTHSDKNLSTAIDECTAYVQEWVMEGNILILIRLLLNRLGFVVYDTEDRRVVYSVFEVLNSRGLAVDLLDKTKSILMGRTFELSSSKSAVEAELHGLQKIWSQIYSEIAKQDVSGDEVVCATATLYYGPGEGKPRSADDSLELLRTECDSFDKPRHVSERLFHVAKKLVQLYGDVYLGSVTEIFHARLLAVAIMSAKGTSGDERDRLLDQWERVTFRIFGFFNKDARHKVGDYVSLAAKIISGDKETKTCDQIMDGLRELGSDYPIKKAISDGLIGVNCYEDHSPEFCRYILWLYEEHLAKTLGAGATVDEHERNEIWRRRAADSIEHILPQNPWGEPWWMSRIADIHLFEYVGRIGNLTLLPTVLNQQARIRPFPEKKHLYKKHNLRSIKEVCSKNDWTVKQIEAREKKIAKWARTRWCDL